MRVEEVYTTEGVPSRTFVEPPNYTELLVDIRSPHKPVIVEGQSGTGKTTTIKKILQRESALQGALYLTARLSDHLTQIEQLALSAKSGIYIIDDFHRLALDLQTRIGDLAKVSAEEGGVRNLPKLVLIGINQVGSGLIQLVPDLAKRFGIHRVSPADCEVTMQLIHSGESSLNIRFTNPTAIYSEAQGDYWLTQLICQTACVMQGITDSVAGASRNITVVPQDIRKRIIARLHASYSPPVKEFCRGRRFRPSNDPYYKLLRAVAEFGSSSVDLTMLANARPDIRASIINIRDDRLRILLEAKPTVAKYFYFNQTTSVFAVEDPALFYFIKHVDWENFRAECGFRSGATKEFEYELALSFAGEHRDLARYLADTLSELDVTVFFDEYFENNFLGKTWSAEFMRIFGTACRFVVVLLDEHHLRKIWPTFERECFTPRVQDGAVIPIKLDESLFPGIPQDIVRIGFKYDVMAEDWKKRAESEIVFRIIDRIYE